MENLQEWIGTQYGPGTKYPSARQLALAISQNRNQNVVSDIERKGILTFDTAQGVARATGVSVLRVLLMSGVVDEAEVEAIGGKALTAGEAQAAALWRELPVDVAALWLRLGSELMELPQGQGESRRVAEGQGSYQAK